MARGMGLFLFGGIGMIVYGLYSLSQAGEGRFMDERFTGSLLLFIGLCWLVGPVLSAVSKTRRQAKERRLFSTGVQASAVVESVEQTSVRINRLPMVRVNLRVQAPDRPPFTHSQRLITLMHALPHPGDVVQVAYDPSNPADLVVKRREGFDASMGVVWDVRRPEVVSEAAEVKPAPHDDDDAERLARLERLRASGELSDAEFNEAKERLA